MPMLFQKKISALAEVARRKGFAPALDGVLRRWGALVVALVAVLYYAQYYRSGLNLGGEGGTVAVVALRLMDGWLPIKDTFLGYNLLWFYPVVWLFEIVGPNYIALRLFFFALCTVTGVLAFLVLRRVTGSGWYSVLGALLPVLVPGMLFRNYMGFLAVLNMLALLQAYVFVQRSAWRQVATMVGAAVALGITFLVRIDLGVFFLLLTGGLIVLFPIGRPGPWRRNVFLALLAALLVPAVVGAVHWPFYRDAERRGFAPQFLGQYTGWVGLIRNLLADQIGFDPMAGSPVNRPVYTPSRVQMIGLWLATQATGEPEKVRDLGREDYRQKKTVADLAEEKSWSERAFVVVTYLPIAVCLILVPLAAGGWLVAVVRHDPAARERALVVLVTTGSALTLFPQFFFFRPDTPHLSEFMVPFFLALACAGWFAAAGWSRRGRAGRLLAGTVIALGAANVGLYLFHALPKESAGTIAAREKRNRELVAENGVRVFLKKNEHEDLQRLAELIKTHTRPGDYLAAYPYQPTINFLTDRPAFEYNLYIDNAHNVSRFHEETLEKFARFRPAVIVIDNRPVNQSEESRFLNWAAETYAWIRAQYTYAGTFRRQEVYFRPDLAPPAAGRPSPDSP
jgi:hypothetical protein